jgi:hypothetical protein
MILIALFEENREDRSEEYRLGIILSKYRCKKVKLL